MKILNLNDFSKGEVLGKGGEGIVYSINGSNNVYKEFREDSLEKANKIGLKLSTYLRLASLEKQ